jgi:hypothetical protein
MMRIVPIVSAALLTLVPATPLWTEGRPAAPPVAASAAPVALPAADSDPAPEEPAGFASGRLDLDLSFGDQPVPYDVMGVFCLPGETVPVVLATPDSGVALAALAGEVATLAPGRWIWTAPADPGLSVLHLTGPDGRARATLNAFVMVPYAEMRSGLLRGYRIGSYPAPRHGRELTDGRPRGFVAITEDTRSALVSPHFELGQFACKSGPDLPKYAVVQPRLVLRLEGLLEAANRSGLRARTFELMSAYRTPLYNRAIGNPTTFTRHQYGDAADIFIDEFPRDGRMDDLNRDGRFDRADALLLHRLAVETEHAADHRGAPGGLSAYSPNHAHGGFVHVDTRGYAARW